jgi:hypothetical protein
MSLITPYVLYQNANNDFAYEFLFIHGISGDARSTWKSTTYSWQKFLADEFPESRAYGLEYTSAIFNISPKFEDQNIGTIAIEAASIIDSIGIGKLPLFVICHSQGGLLLKALISHISTKSTSSHIISPFLENIAGVAFFATPHKGATLANYLKWIWPSTTRQARQLSTDNPMTDFTHSGFIHFAKERSIQVLNLIEMKKTFRITRIVNAPIKEFPESNKSLPRDHIDICKPTHREDEICLLIRAFVLQSIHNKSIKKALSKNTIVHFLDHHFLQMKGIAVENLTLTPSDRTNLEVSFKLALIISDNCIVPGSCLAESDICATFFSRYKEFFPNVVSTENHENLSDYINDSKLRSQGVYDFKPLKLSRFKGLSNISLMLRSRTATQDILNGMAAINFDNVLRDLHFLVEDRSLLRLLEKRWLEVNSDPVSEFIVPPSLEKYLLDGKTDRAVFERISEIVNELYFKSFLEDFDGVIFNPPGKAYHGFKYVEPERVLDLGEILKAIAEPTIWPRLASMSEGELALFRDSNEGMALKANFWGVAAGRSRRSRGWRIG